MRALLSALLFFCLAPLILGAEDFYKLLNLDKTASDKDIKKAYRTLSKKFHPDKNPGNESAHEKFVQIASAYEALSEPETRRIYDQYGHEGLAKHKTSGGRSHDPFDLFSRFFGGSGHFGHHHQQRRGPDMEVRIEVPLRDFYTGASHEFNIEKQHICEECEGSGSADGAVETCNVCGGRGAVIRKQELAAGIYQQVQMGCNKCGGKGKTIKRPCKVCHGERVVRKVATHTLEIEKGSARGARVVYENEADASPDFVAGDLVVILGEKEATAATATDDASSTESDEERTDGTFFRRKGKDLFWKEVLSLREAWMGEWQRNLIHLDGHTVKLARKRGEVVQPGQVDVIRGEGMPLSGDEIEDRRGTELEAERYGNLVVEYVVVLPDRMEQGMRKEFWGVWEKWRKKYGKVDVEKEVGRPEFRDRDEL